MSNPYSKLFLSKKMQESVASVRRVDEKGNLYYMECTGNYYGLTSLPVKALGLLKKTGCSAFITHDEKTEHVLTGRNYDMPHKDSEGNIVGLNLVLHCKPEGKYESLAGADAMWLGKLGVKVYPGCLDDGKTKIGGLSLMPYLCMDGVNEKGFSVSILALDVKDGEHPVDQKAPGKKKVIITQLVRYMLDSCKDVEEAIKLAESYNLVNTFGSDYHLFISDASENSAVLEWRHDTFTAIRTNAVTNCYVCDDDAEDCYYPDGLKEKYVPIDFSLKNKYHMGYGHGYERFKKVVFELNKHVKDDAHPEITEMKKDDARDILSKVAQDYDGMLTSFTQYSVVYDNTDKSADYYVMQDYEKKYSFKL